MRFQGNIAHLVSAGGVVYRRNNGKIDIILGSLGSSKTWGLPKGGQEIGESLEETAVREVKEETGLDVRIQAQIGDIQYRFNRLSDGIPCHKTVHFYLMYLVGGDIAFRDNEFDEVQWISYEMIEEMMTYPNEVRIVKQSLALLDMKGQSSG